MWVKRNTDKPHRCPGCHGIADRAWPYDGSPPEDYGPRTVMHCPYDCGVQWRVGARCSGLRKLRRRVAELDRQRLSRRP